MPPPSLIRLNELYNLMESFFQILNSFQNFGQKPKNIQTIREAWISIKVQCIIYQWIWLDKLYELMKSFFKFQDYFLN